MRKFDFSPPGCPRSNIRGCFDAVLGVVSIISVVLYMQDVCGGNDLRAHGLNLIFHDTQ